MKRMERMVLTAYRKEYEAQEALHDIVMKAFPVGTGVVWTTTKNALSYKQVGIVLRHRYVGEVLIRNLTTGKESWHSARYLSYALL